MKTTFDQVGRVVIPKKLRKPYHLDARTEVEIIPDGDGLRFRVPSETMRFREKDGVLVHCSGSACDLDVTEFINQLRETRARDIIPLSFE